MPIITVVLAVPAQLLSLQLPLQTMQPPALQPPTSLEAVVPSGPC